MKRRIVVTIVAFLFAAIIAASLMFGTRNAQPKVPLPSPNGYDDFAAAGQWLVPWNEDLTAQASEGMRLAISQNAKALETLRIGLKKQSAVPVTNDMNWFSTHMVTMATFKQMARLLIAEGLVHLQEGHTNEAARSFTDCVTFAHAAHRHGLMIHELVAIACQAMAGKQLVPVASAVSPDTRREIIWELVEVDQAREPGAAIVQRDRDWSRDAYGVWRSVSMRIVMRKDIRASEANFEKKHARSVAALRLMMIELAVRAYEAKNGKPPMALAELVPTWLPSVPLDPFSNGPLVYRATTNSFLLYSVGPDGKDDHGTPMKRGEGETGDLLPGAL